MPRLLSRRICPAVVAVLAFALSFAPGPAAQAAPPAIPAAVHYDELEPASAGGYNDQPQAAEPITNVGTGAGENRHLAIHGGLLDTPISESPRQLAAPAEDDGSILLASRPGLSGTDLVEIDATLGDGPHGVDGDRTGDYDVYRVDLQRGQRLTAFAGGLRSWAPIVALYAADGTRLASAGTGFPESVTYTSAAQQQTVYVLLTEYRQVPTSRIFPSDPFDSGSGHGVTGALTDYRLTLGTAQPDTDFYRVELSKGDILGLAANGAADEIGVFRDNTPMINAKGVHALTALPASSPLPRDGNATLAFVADRDGSYAIRARGAAGAYDLDLTLFRPGPETATRPQTFYLDFDGAALDTQIFGGASGPHYLSPLVSFMPAWGLSTDRKDELVARITAVVKENVRGDLLRRSSNPDLAVRIVTSATSPDLFGRPAISRVVVGGSYAESQVYSTGVAQDVDPGNFDQQDQALVPLDLLSAPGERPTGGVPSTKVPDGRPYTINTYLEPESDRMAFVSRALGDVISQQVGRLLGVLPTDAANATTSLGDSGTDDQLFGTGPDLIGGTADDVDVDFVPDGYAGHGLSGLQDEPDVAAWGLAKRLN